jgi:hypothetical protein
LSAVLALIHSPISGPGTWRPVAEELDRRSQHAVVPTMTDDGDADVPYWRRESSSVARHLEQLVHEGVPVLFVGHSGAGPLLPLVAEKLDHPVSGYLFVDAGLPEGGSRLDSRPPEEAHDLRHLFAEGGRFPHWTEEDLREAPRRGCPTPRAGGAAAPALDVLRRDHPRARAVARRPVRLPPAQSLVRESHRASPGDGMANPPDRCGTLPHADRPDWRDGADLGAARRDGEPCLTVASSRKLGCPAGPVFVGLGSGERVRGRSWSQDKRHSAQARAISGSSCRAWATRTHSRAVPQARRYRAASQFVMEVAPSFSHSLRSSQTATIWSASADSAASTADARSKTSTGSCDVVREPNSIGAILPRGSDMDPYDPRRSLATYAPSVARRGRRRS